MDDSAALSQCDMILLALMAGEALTPLDALRRFGCFRLGARIYDLKQRGYEIDMEFTESGGKRFAVYRMGKGTQLTMAI